MSKEATIDIQHEITELKNARVLKSELPIKEKYLSALKNGDTEKINEYLESGAFPHSRITNRSNYEYALKAGFKAPFKLSGNWFEWPRINYKTISFKVNADDTLCNEIYYGKLPNGKWVSDESHRTGNAGGGGTPSIFDKQHDSKESAIRFALDSLKNKLQEGLKEAIRDTCGNYNVKYIKKVLSIISEYEAKQTEPTAEQTFHCDYCKQSFPYKDENDKLTGFFDAGTKHSVCWSCSDLHYETTQPTPATKNESEIKGVAGEIIKKQLEAEQTELTTEQTFTWKEEGGSIRCTDSIVCTLFDNGEEHAQVLWAKRENDFFFGYDVLCANGDEDRYSVYAEGTPYKSFNEMMVAAIDSLMHLNRKDFSKKAATVIDNEKLRYQLFARQEKQSSATQPTPAAKKGKKQKVKSQETERLLPGQKLVRDNPEGLSFNYTECYVVERITANDSYLVCPQWPYTKDLHTFNIPAKDIRDKPPFAYAWHKDDEPVKTATVDGLTQIVMPFEVEEVKPVRDPNAELYGYQAKDKTDRQRFKRKLERTRQWLAELSPEEARAIKKMVSEMTTPPR